MPRDQRHRLFVGIYNSVVALDTRDGSESWRTKLGGSSFVNVYWDGEELFASAKGEVFRIDPNGGAVLWRSPLKGLGTGAVTMASTRRPSTSSSQAVLAELKRRQDAAHHAAT